MGLLSFRSRDEWEVRRVEKIKRTTLNASLIRQRVIVGGALHLPDSQPSLPSAQMLVRPVPSPYNETQVRAYLVRIRFPGFIDNQVAASSSGEEREETRPEQLLPPLPPPTLETLAMVQRRHLCEVPFENTLLVGEIRAGWALRGAADGSLRRAPSS